MTFFLDTANLDEIRKYKRWINGITTNPRIISMEKGIRYEEHLEKILEFGLPTSIELTRINESNKDLMFEARSYRLLGTNVVIKVPMFGDGRGLLIAEWLIEENIPVNATCLMSVEQALLACELGCTYASLFYNRIIDYLYQTRPQGQSYLDREDAELDAELIINETRTLIDYQGFKTKIISGSIRKPEDVRKCLRAGSHIVTVPPKILAQVLSDFPRHPKTTETIAEFDLAWKQFSSQK